MLRRMVAQRRGGRDEERANEGCAKSCAGRARGRGGADDDDGLVALASVRRDGARRLRQPARHRRRSATAGRAGDASAPIAAARVAPVAADWWRGFDDPVLDDLIDARDRRQPEPARRRRRALARAAANVGAADAAEGAAARPARSTRRASASARTASIRRRSPARRADTATVQLERLVGARPVRPQPRRSSRRRSAPSAPRSPTPTPRASCSRSTSRAPTCSSARLVEQRDVLQRALAQREEIVFADAPARLGRPRHRRRAAPERGPAARDAPADRSRRRADRALAPCARRARSPSRRSASTRSRRGSRRCAPVAIPDVVPADLVGRRADIVAARWRVEAAAGDVAAQRAQFYPNVNLTAFVGLSTLGLDRLAARRQRAVRRRPGDPPADLRRRPAARRPARPHRRPRRRGRDLQRHARRRDPRRRRPDQLDAIGRAPADASRPPRRRRPRPPTTWRRSATAPASAATSPSSTPRPT